MPQGKYVRVLIGADGTCSIDALKFTDSSCQKSTQEIAALLGGHVNYQHDKPEARIRERGGHSEREAAR